MFRIAVLITCHNRKDKTLECLRNLYNQGGLGTDFVIQVFLVDDGSTDGTSEAVANKFPKVNIIQGDGNLYWSRGMFTAWEAASKQPFEGYLWLNDDTFLLENGLKVMFKAAEDTHFKSIICGSIQSPNDANILTYGGCKLENGTYKLNYPKGYLEIANIINGNCVLVPHKVFAIVGNLDWAFRHAIGDNEYSLRAKKMGIFSYSTGSFVGMCSNKDSLPKWCQPQIILKERIKNLYSPLGSAEPIIFFNYRKKYFGTYSAIKSFITTHIRLLFPQLWIKKSN